MASLRIAQRSRSVYWTVPAFILLAAMVAVALWGLTAIIGNGGRSAGAADNVPLSDSVTVAISPASIEITSGQTTIVSFTVANVDNMQGAQFAATFPTATLAVVDANPATGVNIITGPLFASGSFVAQNTADNSTGVISYAATIVSPTSPITGSGVMASAVISAKSVESRTCGNINYTWTGLADSNGDAISHSTVSGTVCVNPPPCTGTAVSVGSAAVAQGGLFTIPVTVTDVTDPDGLGNYNFSITYNSTVVTMNQSCTAGNDEYFGSPTVCNRNTPGLVLVNDFIGDVPGSLGTFTLFNLRGAAVGAGGASTPLSLSVTSFNDTNGDAIPRCVNHGLVTIFAAPVATFTATPTIGVAPLNVGFTDGSSGPPTSWLWNFGDGGTSAAQNPSHIYSAQGTYTVTLVVSNLAGSDTATRTAYVDVYTTPSVSFTAVPTNGMRPLTVTFTDTTGNRPSSWLWGFGDGYTSTAQNPSHVYSDTGWYTVTLTAGNLAGSAATTRANYIYVYFLQAATGLTKGVHWASGIPYAVVTVTLDRVYRPDTLATQTIDDGLGSFDGRMTYDSTCVTTVSASKAGQFAGSGATNIGSGSVIYNAFHGDGTGPQTGTLAVFRLRLIGPATRTCIVTNTFVTLGATNGAYVPQDAPDTITVLRGDTQANGAVDINDAMYGAQFLGYTRGADTADLVNCASVRQDGASGDLVDMNDPMFIAHYLGEIKDAWFVNR